MIEIARGFCHTGGGNNGNESSQRTKEGRRDRENKGEEKERKSEGERKAVPK